MTWHLTSDIDEFESAAGDFLRADPVRNTVLLTVVASLRTTGADAFGDAPPYFGWYRDSDVRAAFLRTPPMPLLMSDVPVRAAQELVEILHDVPALYGPTDSLSTIAQAWHAATGRQAKTASSSRLYRLAELTPQQPAPPGVPRDATEADRELLAEWFTAFGIDVGEPDETAMRSVDRRLGHGELVFWEVDGVPVAVAGSTAPIAGVRRVAPVYTPRPLRGRGYAGAVTAEVSRRGLDAGDEVILFTDAANPTSNALYQRLGYREIGRFSELELA